MKPQAAVAFEPAKPFPLFELDGVPPRAGEVLIKITDTGVCHNNALALSSDDPEGLFPVVLGHGSRTQELVLRRIVAQRQTRVGADESDPVGEAQRA